MRLGWASLGGKRMRMVSEKASGWVRSRIGGIEALRGHNTLDGDG